MGYEIAKATIEKMIEKYDLTISEKEKINLMESAMYAYCMKHNHCYVRQY